MKIIQLITKEAIEKRVKELAEQISNDYQNEAPILVGILKGAWVFLADLARNLSIPAVCDFLTVSSYGKNTETSGVVKIVSDLKYPIENRSVLLVEDIVDTGLTLKYITDYLILRNPKSLKVCSLLDKPERHRIEVKIDYLGFTIPNKFVVGYGIDFNEQFRNLPYLGYIEETNL